MAQLAKAFLMFALLALLPAVSPVLASEDGEEFDPVHHTSDGYYLDFSPIGKIELPRIFLVHSEAGGYGLDFFSSTSAVAASGKYRAVEHQEEGSLAETEAEPFEVTEEEVQEGSPAAHSAELTAGSIHLESEIEPVEGKIVVDFSITRHLVFVLIGAGLVLLIFLTLAGRYKRGVGRETAPKGLFQNLFETLIVFVRDDIAKPNLGDKYAKFLPYLLTVFFFILTCNLLGLVPFGATATANLMVTAVLATATFLVTQINGSKDHWAHVFNPPGVPAFVKPIMIPVELLGLFTKPFALAIRLFANMTAGHLVILSLIGLIFTFTNIFGPGVGWGVSPVSVVFSLFIYLLEILVAFIQAYIFTILSALFIGMAVAEHHHEHEDEVGELPTHYEDHGDVTPHLIIGDGAEEVVRRTTVREPQPVATG